MSRLSLNAHLGWILLIVSFAGGIALDPWSLGERDPAKIVGSTRMVLRHAQAVGVGMGVLQLLVAQLLTLSGVAGRVRAGVSWITAAGAVLYALGHSIRALEPGAAWLVPVGAVLNLSGFLTLLVVLLRRGDDVVASLLVGVLALGMSIDCVMGLFAANAATFLPQYLGAEDGVQLRMLRLARAAAIALSTLCLLFRALPDPATSGPLERRAQAGFAIGMTGMPIVLTAAAFVWIHFKWLLGIPALSVFGGVCVAVWLSRRRAPALEEFGWLVIAISMGVGLLIGMYAFDGPLPSPVGEYNDYPRRLSRLGHSYAIVLGLICIFASRKQATVRATRFLVAGTVVTAAAIFLLAVSGSTSGILLVGPTIMTIGMVLAYLSGERNPKAAASSAQPTSISDSPGHHHQGE